MMPYPVFNFDPDAAPLVCVADMAMIDLKRIHGLDKVGLLTVDVNQITQIDFTVCQFDDPDIYSRVIVGDASNDSFSYANGHR